MFSKIILILGLLFLAWITYRLVLYRIESNRQRSAFNMKSMFEELVEKHFGFLIQEYGFFITERTSYPGDSISQGMMVYKSGSVQANTNVKQTIVRVLLDRGYLDLDIGSPDLQSKDYFTLREIMRATVSDVNIDFSPDFSKPAKEILEPQVKTLSNIIAVYGKPFLLGDFSIGDIIIKARNEERERRIQGWKEEKRQKGILN
jgi:hypothetical protein